MRYSIFGELHNAVNGGFAYLGDKDHYDDLDMAKKKFHNYLSTYIGLQDFDKVMVMIIDSYGNVIDSEVWVKEVVVVEPVEE